MLLTGDRAAVARQVGAALGIGEIDVQVLVIAGEGLDPDSFRIDPAETRNVVVAISERHLNPDSLAAVHLHNPYPDLWIRIAGLRIALVVDDGMGRNPVGDWILRHIGFIHLQIRDL